MTFTRTLSAMALILLALIGPAFARPALAGSPEEIALWPGRPPGSGGPSGPEKVGDSGTGLGAVSNVSTPRLRVYRPTKPNGTAIVIAAGGGYFRIQLAKESTPVARWLQDRGYTVFELIYRLPNDGWDADAPFADGQRAMKIVRSRASEFGVSSSRIGFMGFSAGGHLAGMTALLPDRSRYAGKDRFEAASARPDFTVLLFPVVTLREPYTSRSRREIIGDQPSAAAQAEWSLETHASPAAPPTIIFAAADDRITPPAHGIMLFEALRKAGTPAELHLFQSGGHGWGLGTPDQPVSQWPAIFERWMAGLQNK